PRALGNRSILADARNPKMQNLINKQVKFRESFRPFAPVILIEDVSKYFEFDRHSPYMVFTPKLKNYLRRPLPDNFNNSSLKTKLDYEKSDLAATTHVDFSSRIQTISKEQNPRLWSLINNFKSLTDCPILLNTSFNVRGEPIVCTPEDAYRCFMNSGLDFLVIDLYIYDKTEQH